MAQGDVGPCRGRSFSAQVLFEIAKVEFAPFAQLAQWLGLSRLVDATGCGAEYVRRQVAFKLGVEMPENFLQFPENP